MEYNCYRINISKWLPISNPHVQSSPSSLCEEMILLKNTMIKLEQNIILMNDQATDCIESYCQETLYDITMELETIMKNYKSVSTSYQITCSNVLQLIDNYKINYLFTSIKRLVHILAKLVYNFIKKIMNDKNDEVIQPIFRLVNVYNAILDLESDIAEPSINIFSNDCPSVLDVLNHNLSTMRIFQILARNRAEERCHELINCLLAIYQTHATERLKSSTSADEISENSSVEIYRALTKHMTPTHATSTHGTSTIATSDKKSSTINNDINTIHALVINQTHQMEKFIFTCKDVMSFQFNDDVGQQTMSNRKLKKILHCYRRISWAAISGILDHVLLWWSSEKILSQHNYGAATHDLQDWLYQFIESNKNNIPICVKLALLNLCDALGCHVTITCWDEIFRLAYIAAFESASRASSTGGTNTGHMFVEVFQLLVRLSNKCEMGGEWMIGAPLMELALSEQIIILHRLDHSIHTMRLWASQELKLISHTWELENFFLILKGDLNNCIEELSLLTLADHTIALTTDCATISVEVYVCARMRAKIVSEVNANILLLKKSSYSSIKILAKICRVISMANLHMCLPIADYWSKNEYSSVNEDVLLPSPYVKVYIERVLLPVLEALDDNEISCMVLTIMCEAWLDYIYLDEIKFSEQGSYQLLRDFAYVSEWVAQCPIISQKIKDNLLKNEVLRRCEGVGRLLLRHPGEVIAMQKQTGLNNSGNESPASLGLERMPAEMYVPNQEQWLELRAGRNYKLCQCFE